MKNADLTAVETYNRIFHIYDVQRAYHQATMCRAMNRRNILRAIRLQDMAIRAAGGDGDFLTKPLPTLTKKEQAFLDAFNSY